MSSITWQRTPVALRFGLLLIGASHLVHLALWTTMATDDVFRSTLWAVGSTAWTAGDVVCLFGVIELARRSPRATALVWAYGASVAMSALWIATEIYMGRSGNYAPAAVSTLTYLDTAIVLLGVVAWSVASRHAGLTLLVVMTNLIAYRRITEVLEALLGLSSERATMGVHSLLTAVSTGAALLIAMRLPFARPLPPRLARGHMFEAMAIAVAMTGVSNLLLDLHLLGHAMDSPLVLVMVASAAWFVVQAVRARGAGEPGAWPLIAGAAMWVLVAIDQLEVLGFAGNFDRSAMMLPILLIGGLLLALTSAIRIARARGAEAALRVTSACALIIVIGGVASLSASWGDTALPGILRIGGLAIAFGAAAFGLRTAGIALGDGGELPTATLRS